MVTVATLYKVVPSLSTILFWIVFNHASSYGYFWVKSFDLVVLVHRLTLMYSTSSLDIQTKLVVTELSSHKLSGFTTMFANFGDQSFKNVNIATDFNSQSLYHLAVTTYLPSSFIVTLKFSVTFWDFSSWLFTLQEILFISQEYKGINVYSVPPFLNTTVGCMFNI